MKNPFQWFSFIVEEQKLFFQTVLTIKYYIEVKWAKDRMTFFHMLINEPYSRHNDFGELYFFFIKIKMSF